MSDIVTIGGSVTGNYTGQILNVLSGSPTISGSSDTVQSSVSGIGITLTGPLNAISLAGSSDTLVAGSGGSGGTYGDTLVLNGNYNVVEDNGFNDGGVTINGSNNYFSSQQRIETTNFLITGNNDTVDAVYVKGNFLITGNDVLVYANSGSFTISGANDTVIAANAKSILIAGENDAVTDEDQPGSQLPLSLLAGPNSASSDTTPGTVISITGSGASVTTYNNNNTVTSSADSTSLSLQSYGNSATLSGGSSSVSAQTTTETVSVNGANDTVTTSKSLLSGNISSTVPGTTVSLDSTSAATITYNSGSPSVSGIGGGTVNISSSNSSVAATGGGVYNDSVGDNHYTLGGSTKLNLQSGGSTIAVSDNMLLTQDTLGGVQGDPNTIVLGNNNAINFTSSGVIAGYDILSVTGSGSSGFIYGSSQDTVYVGGSGNLFAVQANASASASIGSVFVAAGANTLSFWSGFNSIQATGGADLYVGSNNNSISGGNISLGLQGSGNLVNLTGNATVSDASPWAYGTTTSTETVQNRFTVQSGQFNLGGKDALLQTSGSAALTLAGGNAVTLDGANDSITAGDQVYGGNSIVLNGANDSVTLVNVSDSAATINANVSAFIRATDDTGFKIGGTNTNSNETLLFIGGSGTSNTVLAAGSNMAVTLFGGASSFNVVSGGNTGNNNLNGGTGSGDLFTAGGNNDVLTGGSGGTNTLVSATGNETLTGAGLGNDLFSITGGGGTDMLNDFTGSLVLASGLSVSNETVSGGALNVYLNDGTHLIFAGLTSVKQDGNTFTHSA